MLGTIIIKILGFSFSIRLTQKSPFHLFWISIHCVEDSVDAKIEVLELG